MTDARVRVASVAGMAGLVGYGTVYLAIWLLRRFDESGAALGFLIPLVLSLGVVLAVVIGASSPAWVLGVEWPLAIGGAFSAHATMLFLALAVEFFVGLGDPVGLTLAGGLGCSCSSVSCRGCLQPNMGKRCSAFWWW